MTHRFLLLCFVFLSTTLHLVAQTDEPILSERGKLVHIEDSGYPFYTLTIEFPERKFSETFSVNLEEVQSIDANGLNTWIGKYMAITYTSTLTNALIDLKMNGKSLFPKSSRPPISGAKTITGILSNAAEETTGDIPSELYIKTEEEHVETFPFFITAEIVKANGRKVTAYYQQRTLNAIKSIELIP